MSPRQPARILAISFLFVSGLLLIPYLVAQVKFAANPYYFNDNMYTLYYYFQLSDPELFPDDYQARYYSSFWTPPFFLAMHQLWAHFADLTLLHQLLPLTLWISGAPFIFFAARRLGGTFNAWITLATYLGSSALLSRMTPSLPHTFAFPMLCYAVAALLSGRYFVLALITIVSAGFYPIIAPITGCTLAAWLLFPQLAPAIPRRGTLHDRPVMQRLVFLAVVAGLALASMGSILTSRMDPQFGRAINIFAERDTFPETGYRVATHPFVMLMEMYWPQYAARLGWPIGLVMTIAVLQVLFAGLILRNNHDRRPRGMAPFIIGSALPLTASILFDYANAYRFATYPCGILIMLFFPLAMRRISRRCFAPGKKGAAFVFMMLFYLYVIARPYPEASGYYRLEPFQIHVVEFARTLPKNVMIAGFPGDASGRSVEAIPYYAKRQVLVIWETHARLHDQYILALRKRVFAIVDAYLADDVAPLIALRDTFKVDYFVVNEADFTQKDPPEYFEPFDTRIKKMWKEHGDRPFYTLELAKKNHVYARDGIYFIDLHTLPKGTP